MTLVIQKPTGASLVIEKPIGSKVLLTAKQYIPAVIGEPFGGGYFAGYISHTADGNPTHALIVAPAATGATGTGYTFTDNLAWKTSATTTPDTDSEYDGAANTAAMVTAGIADHPAAEFCVNLSIGGYTDWYLPARYELGIAYFNLKPSTTGNTLTWGENPYSVPRRDIKYTLQYPEQTTIAAFASGGSEAFPTGYHWASQQNTSSTAWRLLFGSGTQIGNLNKSSTSNVRAFRRIAL